MADPTENNRKLTVLEAAEVLGISEGAVRMRIKRGSLTSVREGAHVYVLLERDHTTEQTRTNTDRSGESGALTSELRDRLRYVEGQLEAERQAHAEARRIIAGLVERIPALEPPGEPETPSEPVPGTEPPERETPTERPWWRRVFGG